MTVFLATNFITDVLNNTASLVRTVGSGVVVFLGILLIIASVMQMVKAFASGNSRADWLMIMLCLFVGGIFAIGGWNMLTKDSGFSMVAVGRGTADSLLDGTKPAAVGSYTKATTGGAKAASEGLDILSKSFILPFGRALAISVGALLVILATVHVGKFFLTHSCQIGWARVICMGVIGACMFATTPSADNGWNWVRDTAVSMFKDTAENVGNGASGTLNPGDIGIKDSTLADTGA